jgi:hypothetical protein
MANSKLGEQSQRDIRDAMTGLSGPAASAEAERLAVAHNTTKATIYNLTKDLRPGRKERADKGNRKAELLQDAALKFAATWVATKHVSPEEALETAKLNGFEINVSLSTFRRYLNQHQLNAASLKRDLRPYRDWEAEAPRDLFQFDMSALKERWLDVTTRRILYVKEADGHHRNHPNTKESRVPVWRFALRDDHSRLAYIRYYALRKPTSTEVVDFLLNAFRELGVPKQLYTDNDAVIVGKRLQRAAKILNEALAGSGGFECITHLPYNARATGKIEAFHRVAEAFEKLIGVKINTPDLANLNRMADNYCRAYNRKPHRTTGEQPALRFRSTTEALRMPPPATLDAALKADEFQRQLKGNLTVSFNNQRIQLPRTAPFNSWIGQTLTFVWYGDDAPSFVVIGLDGKDYEISRELAKPDKAGEFKAVPETIGQQALKTLQAHAAELTAQHKEQATDFATPYLDSDPAAELEKQMPTFPQKQDVTPAVEWAEAAHALPSIVSGRALDYWEALDEGIEQGWLTSAQVSLEQCQTDKAWLTAIFAGRDTITTAELATAVAARNAATTEINAPTLSNVFQLRKRA